MTDPVTPCCRWLLQGDTEAQNRKCCFFLRAAPPGQSLDPTKEGEQVSELHSRRGDRGGRGVRQLECIG